MPGSGLTLIRALRNGDFDALRRCWLGTYAGLAAKEEVRQKDSSTYPGGLGAALNCRLACRLPGSTNWSLFPVAMAIACGMMFSSTVFAFDFADVAQRAQRLAAKPFKPQESNLPDALVNLSYFQYRDIRFKPERQYWRGAKLRFELAFFHQGLHFNRPVKIHEVAEDGVHEIKFSPEDFDYGMNKVDRNQVRALGFAGFRVHYPLNSAKYKDEALSFLGASYFRALGTGQRYGLSARGLALDTGLAAGEEFPQFVEFWIGRPAPYDKELTIHALLDSPRAAAAYRFVLRPGAETVMDIKVRLYLREKVGKLGLAALSTMYFYGENERPQFEDFRPEVHDSDGLSIHSGSGEWLWRPLVNPRRLLVSSYSMDDFVGFGLMQRDRAFGSYQDVFARYELRPSVWVEPKGKWGAGRIELIQIPTPDDTNDNIVAFWVPAAPPPPGKPIDFEYRLHWQKDAETRPPLAWVMQSRAGRRYTGKPDNSISFNVDFVGALLAKRPADAKVTAVVTADANGEVLEANTYRNEATGGWRTSLRIRRRDEKKPVELRAYLKEEDKTLSETWSYLLPPT